MTHEALGSAVRLTLTASGALTTAVLPVFLLGALSDAVGVDLHLSEVEVGAAVTVPFAAAAVSAAPAGRLVERVGETRAMRAGVALGAAATAAIGAAATAWWHVAAALAVVGVTIAVIDTGAARAFAGRLPATRQGTAFGVKEASVPAGALLAGLTLPALGAGLGWRTAFLLAPVLSAVVLLLLAVPERLPQRTAPDPDATATSRGRPGRPLVLLALGAGLAVGAATAAATFLVPSGLARGLRPAVAGAVLSTASVASILTRVVAGRWADRLGRPPASALAVLMAGGAVGAAILAVAESWATTLAGAVLVLGAGWGWTGLAFLTAVRLRPEAPASAAGVVLTGLAAGGALAPIAFGAAVEVWSFAAAWTAGAVAMAGGAAATTVTGRWLARSR